MLSLATEDIMWSLKAGLLGGWWCLSLPNIVCEKDPQTPTWQK